MKIVLVGVTTAGKSALILKYLHGKFNHAYEPTVLEITTGRTTIRGQVYQLEVVDTNGDFGLNTKRPVLYKDADLFMICCATDHKRDSLGFVKEFADEIRSVEHGKPIVLVQTKIDLADEANRDQIKDVDLQREA